jgi:hypothetical protein
LFFFSDFQTKEFKEYTRRKVRALSSYQFYHLLDWLLENVKDDALVSNLDILFDFSTLNPKKYLPSEWQSYPGAFEPLEKPLLPNRFYKDCRKFFHKDQGTLYAVLRETYPLQRVDRFLLYIRARKNIKNPEVDFERLLNLMSLEERLCFPVYNFPDQEAIPFYGHALNYLRFELSEEADWLRNELLNEIQKEGKHIKRLFIGNGKEAIPFAMMDRSVVLLPMLVDFQKWKQLVMEALRSKGLFGLLKKKLLISTQELIELLGDDYFQDLTFQNRQYITKAEEPGTFYVRLFSAPLVHSLFYTEWLKNLKATNLKTSSPQKDLEEVQKNQIIITKKGSQLKLKKAFIEFLNHIKLKIDDERSRAIESFVYRNFKYEYDENINFSKRTVNNFGYKPLDFIPPKQAKNFAKLLLYLSDKNYLLSNKTQIIRTLDEDIHEKNGKDGFSYSSLIRIPSDEHHLFPDKVIRRRIRSILKIDD